MKFLLKYRRTLLLAVMDASTIILSATMSYILLRFMTKTTERFPYIAFEFFTTMEHCFALVVACLFGLLICGAYRYLWRYAAIRELMICIVGMFVGALGYYAFRFVTPSDYSDIHVLLTLAFSTVGVMVVRMIYSYAFEWMRNAAPVANKKRTLIVGAGNASNRILMEMRSSGSSYLPVAIVDDDIEKQGRRMHGVSVKGSTEDIPSIVERDNINTIFVAIPSCTADEKKRIVGICSETICQVKIIPHINEIIESTGLIGQAQNINIEDLLGRDVIKFDCEDVKALISGKTCMVTGGGGSIGSELCRQIAKFGPKKLIIVDIYENNAYDIQQELLANNKGLDLDVMVASVRDYDKMKSLFEKFKPELVYHAAAHKHVPLMETSPEEAIKNNIFGTFNVASLANEYNVRKFVLVSTDKAVNPTNVMGATKRCCEMIAQYFAQISKATEFVAVRFGNVLGSNGSVIPLFEKQIAAGGPVTVTHPDIIRYFMTIPEAVSLILQAGTIAKGGEIFVLDMGEPVKILSLAENLIKLHGKEPYKEIDIKFTGLRPGEKLFEELLMSEEGLKETQNKKIFIGTQIEIDAEKFMADLEIIREKAENNNSAGAIEELRKIVPTFNHVVLNK